MVALNVTGSVDDTDHQVGPLGRIGPIHRDRDVHGLGPRARRRARRSLERRWHAQRHQREKTDDRPQLDHPGEGYRKSRAKIQGARNPILRDYIDTERLTNSVLEVTRIGRRRNPPRRGQILGRYSDDLQKRVTWHATGKEQRAFKGP